MSRLFYSHNFGHNGPLLFHGLGINGKISELQSGLGLVVLSHINEIIDGRKKIINYYSSELDFTHLRTLKLRANTEWNYSYFPVIFETENQLLNVQKRLNEINVFPRRYFYPSLNTIKYVSGPTMPVSEEISSKILCLRLSHYIADSDLEIIVRTTNKSLRVV
jgi:dTDP-4-amino-4,6-dideoxygalactose transaminase